VGRRSLACALGLPAALCGVWTVFAGKDLNWDLLNYHYYGPFQLLAGRLQQDFFAASAQSYVNPLGYVPFYALVAAGTHSVLVSIAFAAAHSLCLALLYFVAWRLFAHLEPRARAGMAALAAALGGASAVFWATVGTSFLDPLLAVPMLAGLLLLLERRHFALAGALFGAAAALKYSNAIFAVAALPLAFVSRRSVLAYAAGGAAAVALLAGPWLFLMWREFGNPLFPMGTVSVRFTPQDLLAALSFPFRMAALDRSLYVETFAPDLRPAALIALALALPFTRKQGVLRDADARLLTFFLIGVALWLLTSGNGRYGMVLLLLTGVLAARLAERALPGRAVRLVLALLLAVQLGMLAVASHARWYLAEPWSRHWFPYAVPERALREPALYLTLEMLPMAVVAPFVHPDSAFVNLRGQRSLAPDEPRLIALLEKHRERVRALGRNLELKNGAPEPAQVTAYDGTLTRIGYRLDTKDCFTIAWRPDEDGLSRLANAASRTPPASESLSVVSCGLVAAPPDPARAELERRASIAFDRLEKACPRLFRGHTAVTEPLGGGWSRHYVDLDARLEAFGERVMLNRYRAGTVLELGRLDEWLKGSAALPAECR